MSDTTNTLIGLTATAMALKLVDETLKTKKKKGLGLMSARLR